MLTWISNGAKFQNAYIMNKLTNVIYYAIHIFPSYFWCKYIYNKLHFDEKKIKRFNIITFIPLFIYILLSLSNLFVDIMFTINESNEYIRKSCFILSFILSYSYLLASTFLVIKNKRSIKQTDYYPLLLFIFLPAVCGVIQILFFGFSLIWIGTALSSLIVYIHVQNDAAITDLLTGLYNRRRFQEYIDEALHHLGDKDSLTGVMLDIDNFKHINDNYGHVIGDHALEEMAGILKKSVHNSDFLARYAGDEFVIVFKNKSEEYINNILSEMKKNTDIFNHTKQTEYTISYSYGVYSVKGIYKITTENFIRNMDKKMYESKGQKQSAKKKFL